MKFEYDPKKSEINFAKHGINFEHAQVLWDDEHRLEIPAKRMEEPRFLVIGKIKDKLWSAVITYRDEEVRIISVRHSRDNERELYEDNNL
jgi:uncharacterized DUF497 family protein